MAPFASFIIPTLGRESLWATIHSLIAQTDDDWEAIIVVDPKGELADDMLYLDERIKFIPINSGAFKKMLYGSAGLLRNYGIREATGEWVAFVDDDDTLEPLYVNHLREHAEDYPLAEVVIFRMLHPKNGVLPPLTMPIIRQGLVGISYAVKREAEPIFIRENVVSTTDTRLNTHEDFELLKKMQGEGRTIYFSPHIDYKVGA